MTYFHLLLVVFLILFITCAEISIVMCYFQLCAEDYHWWWRSFLTSGSSAGYMFAYSIFYFYTKLEITKPVSAVIYFANMWVVTLLFFLLTGISMRVPEATALVEAVMDGKVHLDYVTVGGQQYLLTTVAEAAYYGQSTSAKGGIVLVKTRRLLIVAIYSEAATMAQAIPHVHSFAEELDSVQQQ